MIKKSTSPIVRGIADALKWTSCDIRVHLSKRFLDPNPFASANQLFLNYQLDQPPGRASVLIYVNLRKGKVAVSVSPALRAKTNQDFWSRFLRILNLELQSTHYERAIANSVRGLAMTLGQTFPPHTKEASHPKS